MSKKRFFRTLASLAGAAVLVPGAYAQPPSRPVPGQVLVEFRTGVSKARAEGVIQAHGARSLRHLPQIGVHVVGLPAGGNAAAYMQALRLRPEVLAVEVDQLVPPSDLIPNDPYYSSEWHLAKIKAPAAWPVTTGSTSIVVAVLDTGVDGAHPDLAPKMVAGWNVYDNNSDSRDVYGHGTAVAGTVAAAGNNGVGVASVAWSCWIMPVRISDAKGWATYSDIAAGLAWAADHGARVANISYEVTASSTVTSAAKYFQGRGGVVTSSAGNYGKFDSKADNPYIVTVSATDPNDQLYSWSNTGNNIDVSAPGCAYTTLTGGRYGTGCGTSFSSPIVAGVAALVLSVRPTLSPAEVIGILRSSADDLGTPGFDPKYGAGRVNAARAVTQAGGAAPTASAADTQPPVVAITAPAAGAFVTGNAVVTVSYSDNVGVVRVELRVDGVLQTTTASAPFTTRWNSSKAAPGAHTLEVRAFDAAGNCGFSSPVTVTTP